MDSLYAGMVIYSNNFEYLGAFYQQVMGFEKIEMGEAHIILQRKHFELTLLQHHEEQQNRVRSHVHLKPIFYVDHLQRAREAAELLGGHVNSAQAEWLIEAYRVCDGVDSEGNVFQLRAPQAR